MTTYRFWTGNMHLSVIVLRYTTMKREVALSLSLSSDWRGDLWKSLRFTSEHRVQLSRLRFQPSIKNMEMGGIIGIVGGSEIRHQHCTVLQSDIFNTRTARDRSHDHWFELFWNWNISAFSDYAVARLSSSDSLSWCQRSGNGQANQRPPYSLH